MYDVHLLEIYVNHRSETYCPFFKTTSRELSCQIPISVTSFLGFITLFSPLLSSFVGNSMAAENMENRLGAECIGIFSGEMEKTGGRVKFEDNRAKRLLCSEKKAMTL